MNDNTFRIGGLRAILDAGQSLDELQKANDLSAFIERAKLLEEFFDHYSPILLSAEEAVSLNPNKRELAEVLDDLSVSLGLQGAKRSAAQRNAAHKDIWLVLRYLLELSERAPDEMRRYRKGELSDENFPNDPMWDAADAVRAVIGGGKDPSTTRERYRDARAACGGRFPIPRGNPTR